MSMLTIRPLGCDFTVCQIADSAQLPLDAAYCFFGKTEEERSLVCLTADVPDNTVQREDGWRGFCIEGVLDFSLVGILSKIAALLAEARIGIFAVSTYNTDYIFVKAADEQRAYAVLRQAGYQVRS